MMEEDLKVLEELGLSQNEAKVYTSLLELGLTSPGRIAAYSKLHRPNVYDCLRKLANRGLVTHIVKEDKTLFEAAQPENLANLLKEKEIRLSQILPRLALNKQLGEKSKVKILEGISGIKSVTDDILLEKKIVFTLGIPHDIGKKMPFVGIYHARRTKAKIWQYHLYSEEASDRIAYLNSLPYTRAAQLVKGFDMAVTVIYGDKVSFFIWSEPPFAVLIEEKRMAEAYKKYFKVLWKDATGEDLEDIKSFE